MVAAGAAVQRRPSAGGPGTIDAAAAMKTVVPDLGTRLARFKVVRMPFDESGLTTPERQMIDQLVVASRYLESMYWRQSDPDGLALYRALDGTSAPVAQQLRRYLTINGSRWDLVRENEPFVGRLPMPPGHALYPPDLTRAQIDAYIASHPGKKDEIYNPYTFVRRQGADLVGQRYHDELKPF